MDGLSCGGNTLIGPSKSGGQLCNPWSNSGEAMAIPAFDFWSLSKQGAFVIPPASSRWSRKFCDLDGLSESTLEEEPVGW